MTRLRASIEEKLRQADERHQELSGLLSLSEVVSDRQQFEQYSREYAELSPIVETYADYLSQCEQWEEAQGYLNDADLEMRALAKDMIQNAEQAIEGLITRLNHLLLPKDPDDEKDVFLEIRAGTGGDEAALFVGDLFKMYSRYAQRCGWQQALIQSSPSEAGGFKQLILKISGQQVYRQLKFESGCHRVQRVPATESQGRVHTSACTVAVMPEVSDVENIDINPNDLRVDTFRASGAGGQHVNKTDSAIRITHLPTNTVVECQDERSQHKNRAKAMSLLQAHLLDQVRQTQEKEQASTRKSLVGSGDRSERIRTYNFPQGRVTDHRINLTLYSLDELMDGDMDPVLSRLHEEYNAGLLAQLSEELG